MKKKKQSGRSRDRWKKCDKNAKRRGPLPMESAWPRRREDNERNFRHNNSMTDSFIQSTGQRVHKNSDPFSHDVTV